MGILEGKDPIKAGRDISSKGEHGPFQTQRHRGIFLYFPILNPKTHCLGRAVRFG